MWFSDWAIRLMVVAVALIGLLQIGPVILSSGDIGDNYYDEPPAVVREQTTWLGLFIKEGTSEQKTRESPLEVTRVKLCATKRVQVHRVSARHHSTMHGAAALGSAAALGGRSDNGVYEDLTPSAR